MTTTLITGANKGLGYETARRLTEAGHTVLVGARDPRRGRAAAERIGARFLPLDVTDEESVLAASERVREEFDAWTSSSTTPESSAPAERPRS